MQKKKTSKIKRILKAIFTDFSGKEKAITRYTKLYMAGITQNKQKALFSLCSLNKNSRNVLVNRGEK